MNRPRSAEHHSNLADGKRVHSQELDRLAFYCLLLAAELLEDDVRKGIDNVIAEVRGAGIDGIPPGASG